MSQLMWKRYLTHQRPAKAQASLRIRTVSPEPSLFAHTIYGSRGSFRQPTTSLALLSSCAFEFIGTQSAKVPFLMRWLKWFISHNTEQLLIWQAVLSLFSHTHCYINWAAAWQKQQNDLCAQQRLGPAWASTQSDQSLLCAWRSVGSMATNLAHSGRMLRLIWVFAERKCHFFILLCCVWTDWLIEV